MQLHNQKQLPVMVVSTPPPSDTDSVSFDEALAYFDRKRAFLSAKQASSRTAHSAASSHSHCGLDETSVEIDRTSTRSFPRSSPRDEPFRLCRLAPIVIVPSVGSEDVTSDCGLIDNCSSAISSQHGSSPVSQSSLR